MFLCQILGLKLSTYVVENTLDQNHAALPSLEIEAKLFLRITKNAAFCNVERKY